MSEDHPYERNLKLSSKKMLNHVDADAGPDNGKLHFLNNLSVEKV
jgi:hypothetical protein